MGNESNATRAPHMPMGAAVGGVAPCGLGLLCLLLQARPSIPCSTVFPLVSIIKYINLLSTYIIGGVEGWGWEKQKRASGRSRGLEPKWATTHLVLKGPSPPTKTINPYFVSLLKVVKVDF